MNHFTIALKVILFLLLVYVSKGVFEFVKETGRQEVQILWAEDKEKTEQEIRDIIARYSAKEQAHREANRNNVDELNRVKKEYEDSLRDIDSSYASRLHGAEERADIYKRQAEAGAAGCTDLANHASRLDTTLEEGRSLVRELRETLRLRDNQVKALSFQITNDRVLIDEH